MAVYYDEQWKQWRYRTIAKLRDGRTRVRVSGTPAVNTKDEAKKTERDHIFRTLDPPPSDGPRPPTFSEYAKEWLKTYPLALENRPSVRLEKARIVKLHLEPVLGPLPLDEVRGAALTRLFAGLKSLRSSEKSLAPQTRRNIRMVLRRLLASAVEDGKIAAIPMIPTVKVPRLSDGKKWDWLRPEESDRLLAVARDGFERALFMFALHTGARLGETLAIRWSDVDFKHLNITIRRALVRGDLLEPKSGHGREVAMTNGLAAALKRIKHDRELIFSRPDGSALSYDDLHGRLTAALAAAKLRKIRWHDLRHTFCSQLIGAGVPMRQVQEWAGHSTITVTERYSHLTPGAGRSQISALDRPISRKLNIV